jgi:hypothetical protein
VLVLSARLVVYPAWYKGIATLTNPVPRDGLPIALQGAMS